MKKEMLEKDLLSENSWLISSSLVKRSLAIYGHCLIGSILVAIALFIPLLLLALI